MDGLARRAICSVAVGSFVIGTFTNPAAHVAAAPVHYDCQPELSFFCRNVHVGCAGQTRSKTARFTARIDRGSAVLFFEGRSRPIVGVAHRANGLIIRFGSDGDWIRIENNGSFSHRTYRDGTAAMSFGRCRQTP